MRGLACDSGALYFFISYFNCLLEMVNGRHDNEPPI